MIDTLMLTTFIFVTVLYFAARWISDASIMDIFWGLGFILNTTMAVYLSYYNNIVGALALPKLIICLLVLIWGIRLSWHILARHRGEDPRYVAWRKDWGSTYWWRSYVQIFLLQGALMLLVLTPVILFMGSAVATYSVSILGLGAFIWLVGFVFEAVADWQLERFRENVLNRGKLLTHGLWRYSRHPNYFGEVVQWWGIFVATLCVPTITSQWYLLVIGPLVITVLIRFVSGVPMTEARMRQNKHFHAYAVQTNTFVPWFSK